MNQSVLDKLRQLDACEPAIEWVATQPNARAAWDQCRRADWMLWLLARRVTTPYGRRHRRLVEMTCLLVRPYVDRCGGPGKARGLGMLDLVRRWGQGDRDVTVEMITSAVEAYIDAAFYGPAAAYIEAADAVAAAAYAVGDPDLAWAAATYAASAGDSFDDALAEMAERLWVYHPNPPRLDSMRIRLRASQ